MADEHTRVPWWRRKMLALDAMRSYPAVEEMGPPRPLRAIHVEEMRRAARAWRGALPRNQSIHDRVDDLIDEIDRLRKPENAAACILAGNRRMIAPVVLNAVQAEREKWEQNPDVKRGKVSPETITLAMFEACLRAITEITEGKADE